MAERMMEGDLVVAPGQFALLLDATKGNVDVLVGPTKTSLSNTDSPVMWDRENRTFVMCSQAQAKQQFPTASEGYYIVVENPAMGNREHPPVGSRTNAVELSTGRRVNIPGPCSFALYPGQSADVIEGHHLRSNQYLLVRVYNDDEARLNWARGVVRAADGSETTMEPPTLHMGQMLVIKGTDVSFYIPPTGVEVLVDENGNFVRDAETLERLEFCILLNENGDKRYETGPKVVFPEPTETFVAQAGTRKGRAIELNEISGVYVKVIASYVDENGTSHNPGDELFITGKEVSIYYPRPEHSLIKYGEKIIHYAIAIPEGEGRYVLNRLTGNVRIEHGPSMFLPDPRKEVVVRRILSDNEVSLLYPGNSEAFAHNKMLRESSQINAGDVPMSSMTLSEDIDTQFRTSRSSAVAARKSPTMGGGVGLSASVPMASMSEGMPATRSMSMSYAATSSSAESAAEALVGGAVMQRKTSNTPPRTITLNTKYDGVVSVDVWTGYAALLVRKDGSRRVIVGPKTVLLEYDERPMMLELSTGTPKTDNHKLKTGFLRVVNNSVSDVVTVETSDSFSASIGVRYHLNFTGDSPESWFAVENYVQFLAERMRSMIRREAKKHTVRDLRDNAIDIVRTLVLGVAVPGEGRPGRVFHENNMMIFDLDVETPKIQNDVDNLLRTNEQQSLRQSLELDMKERELAHQRRLEQIERELAEARAETRVLNAQIQLQDLRNDLEMQLSQVNTKGRIQEETLVNQLNSQNAMNEITSAEVNRQKMRDDQALEAMRGRVATAIEEVQGRATAITPQLAEVIQRLGDEAVLEKIAEAVAPLSILGGGSVVDILKGILGENNPSTETLMKLIAGYTAGKMV